MVMNVNFETSASAAGWKGLVRPSLPQRPRDRHWYRERHAACGVRRVWREALGEGPGGVGRAACSVRRAGRGMSRVPPPAQINDPDLDGSCQINKGFRQARQLLLDINRLGLPTSTEYLDTISPQFIADLVSWAAVGAGTAESEAHRDLSSGLSTPVGFKNGNSGDSGAAIEAVSASAGPHAFLSVSKQGVAGIVETSGNRDCHVVLHGGTGGPNHSEEAVRGVCNSLAALQLPARVMVDCGSYNARQSPSVQAEVAEGMAARIAKGDECVFGLVLHSFLVSGRQDVVAGGAPVYGMSVTEPCMDWSATSAILQKLAAAVRQRRALNSTAQPDRKKPKPS